MEENKKRNKGLIITLIILVLLLLGVIIYVLTNKNIMKDNENNNTTKSIKNTYANILFKDINEDFSNYKSIYWDYDKLYNNYFTFDENSIPKCSEVNQCMPYYIEYGNNFESKFYSFVKIQNNKLYWLIDNKWTIDSVIADNIDFFNINEEEGSILSFEVLTSSKEFYEVAVNDNDVLDLIPDGNILKYNLSSKIYNGFEYNKIEINGEVSAIAKRFFPADCDAMSAIIAKIDNKLYILNDNKFDELTSFLKDYTWLKYINNLDNTCIPPFGNIININIDGTLENIVDENNKSIHVKYYLQIYKGDYYSSDNNTEKKLYDFIIDKDNYSYIIDRNKIDLSNVKVLKRDEKINNISTNENEYKQSYVEKIEFENGKVITFSKL